MSEEKLIASNTAARHHYTIEEVVEAGLVLTGTEVKSLRTHAPQLRESFVEVRPHGAHFEAWLVNTHIAPYAFGNIWNHEPLRRRKLLLHVHQLKKLYGAILQKGMTVVPLRLYFKNGLVKAELGLGKGKKQHDKRQDLKRKADDREIARALRKSD